MIEALSSLALLIVLFTLIMGSTETLIRYKNTLKYNPLDQKILFQKTIENELIKHQNFFETFRGRNNGFVYQKDLEDRLSLYHEPSEKKLVFVVNIPQQNKTLEININSTVKFNYLLGSNNHLSWQGTTEDMPSLIRIEFYNVDGKLTGIRFLNPDTNYSERLISPSSLLPPS